MNALERLQLRLHTNDVETGESAAYPDVRPLLLGLDPDLAFRAARRAADHMPRWTIVGEDPAARRFRAEARTAALRFVDDVWVRVEPAPEGSRVRVRSASRVGVTDFGTNARRIRAYLTRLSRTAPDG